jgi:type IV pilus assembly protein PilC
MNREKDYLLENLSMLIASGMDVLTALESIKQDVKSKKVIKIIDQISNSIRSGSTFWLALQQAKLFPDYVISFIKIGEETGKLPDNLKIVIEQQQKERDFRSKIQSATMYPLFVFSLTLIIGLGIAWFILPRLAQVFSTLKLKLPVITQILISVGLFLGKYGFIAVPLIIIFISLTVYIIFIYKKTRFIGENILFRVPVISSLIKEIEISRFGFLLGTLLSSGIPAIDALDSLTSATTSSIYKKLYLHLRTQISQGNSFQKSLSSYKDIKSLMPSTIRQMLSSAEQSGHLQETLLKISQNYSAKIDTTTKNLSVMLEPILLIIIWLGVLGVALAVILPIYSLIGGLNK